jgi:small conductance mechanosensitive channel
VSTTAPIGEVAEDAGQWFDWILGAPLQSIIAVLVGVLALGITRWLISRGVRSVVAGGTTVRRHARRLFMRTGVGSDSDPLVVSRRVQRAETMGSVLRSTAALVIGIVVVTVVANINSWDLGPVLASAGVLGVALGFGAQTLVKDFLAGLFMLIEDQYGVGDVVDLGAATGSVESIGLRVTQVRDLSGTLWYVRNGEVLRVGNMTQGWSRARVEVLVPSDGDVDRATEALAAVAADIADDPELAPHLLGDAEVTAFEDLSAESIRLRLLIKVAPAQQWVVQRALRGKIQQRFAEAGIPLALPRREVLVERERKAEPDAS